MNPGHLRARKQIQDVQLGHELVCPGRRQTYVDPGGRANSLIGDDPDLRIRTHIDAAQLLGLPCRYCDSACWCSESKFCTHCFLSFYWVGGSTLFAARPSWHSVSDEVRL